MIGEDHPLPQLGNGLLAIWKNVDDLQSREWAQISEVPRPRRITELAAADAASMALGIHFAPYSEQFRRYLIEFVKHGIARTAGVEDEDTFEAAYATYLDAISRFLQGGEDADSGDVLANVLRKRLRTNAPGLERRAATRLGRLTVSAKEFVETVGPEVDEPTDLPPAFQASARKLDDGAARTHSQTTKRASPEESFFLEKIAEGLRGGHDLSSAELGLLLTPVMNLGDKAGYAQANGLALQAKCVRALEVAFRRDTELRKRAAAVEWREHNERLYKYSRTVLSPIVQEWYLTVGREQEKAATGCFAVILAVALCAAAVAALRYAVASAG